MPVCPALASVSSSVFAAAPPKSNSSHLRAARRSRARQAPPVTPAPSPPPLLGRFLPSSVGSGVAQMKVQKAKPQSRWQTLWRSVTTQSLTLSDTPGSIVHANLCLLSAWLYFYLYLGCKASPVSQALRAISRPPRARVPFLLPLNNGNKQCS